MAIGASKVSPILCGDPIVVQCVREGQARTKVLGGESANVFGCVLSRLRPCIRVGYLAAVRAAVLRILEVDESAVPEVAVGALQSHFLLRAFKAAHKGQSPRLHKSPNLIFRYRLSRKAQRAPTPLVYMLGWSCVPHVPGSASVLKRGVNSLVLRGQALSTASPGVVLTPLNIEFFPHSRCHKSWSYQPAEEERGLSCASLL